MNHEKIIKITLKTYKIKKPTIVHAKSKKENIACSVLTLVISKNVT